MVYGFQSFSLDLEVMEIRTITDAQKKRNTT